MAGSYFIVIIGASGSGKTTLARKMAEYITDPANNIESHVLSLDTFYKELSLKDHELALRGDYNFDRPAALNFEKLVEIMYQLQKGKSVEMLEYSFATHSHLDSTIKIEIDPTKFNVFILEGVFAYCHPEVRKLCDYPVLIDTPLEVCKRRRLIRDVKERGRTPESVEEQFERYARPAVPKYVYVWREQIKKNGTVV